MPVSVRLSLGRAGANGDRETPDAVARGCSDAAPTDPPGARRALGSLAQVSGTVAIALHSASAVKVE